MSVTSRLVQSSCRFSFVLYKEESKKRYLSAQRIALNQCVNLGDFASFIV